MTDEVGLAMVDATGAGLNEGTAMRGHVFIVHGDLTQFSCDAWLVPSGTKPAPGAAFQHAVASKAPAGTPDNWSDPSRRVIPWDPLHPGWPQPWVVRTYNWPGAPATDFVESGRQFLEVAAKHLGPPRAGRAVPLLALPLIGTGKGGGADQAGDIVRHLLPVLYEFTATRNIDVALVLINPASYAAAQAVRSVEKGDEAWPELSAELRTKVDGLAELAFRDELVLFLGAGVSKSAGLPTWGELLDRLAGERLAADQEFQKLAPLDKARVAQRHLPKGDDLGKAVAAHLRAEHYSLVHGLLASLPVQEVVTTNYDTLFEMASAAIKKDVDVLPYEPTQGGRWLLKLHGCVSRPEDIVLTREHYLRFDAERAALAGLVEGLLLTRHLLFIGFSLNDDNFHRIADAVRRAVRRQHFGTSLSVAGNRHLRELWSNELDWVELGQLPGSGRLQEIFLDRLAARTVATADHLFDERYAAILSGADIGLREELRKLAAFVSHVPGEERRGAAWAEVERFLTRLGLHIPNQPPR